MSTPDNVDFFNRFTVIFLEHLYSEFPTPIDIDVNQLATELLDENVEERLGYKLLDSVDHAVNFLADEGFIVHGGTNLEGGVFTQARLTAKGLAVLNSIPDALSDRETLISRMRQSLRGGVREAGAEVVRQLVQYAFTSAVAITAFVAR